MALRKLRDKVTGQGKRLEVVRRQHRGTGGITIEGLLLGFPDKGSLEDQYVKGRELLLVLLNIDQIVCDGVWAKPLDDADPSMFVQVKSAVSTWPKDDDRVREYCAQHIAEAQVGEYQGDFPIEKYYDSDKGELRSSIYEIIERGQLVKVKLWSNSAAVQPNVVPGNIVCVTGAKANRCTYIPKARGAAVAKEKAETALADKAKAEAALAEGLAVADRRIKEAEARAAAQTAVHAATNNALDDIERAADGTINIVEETNGDNNTVLSLNGGRNSSNRIRHPGMFELSFSSGGTVSRSSNNGDGSMVDKLRQYFAHDTPTLRYPEDPYDCYTIMLHMSSYQHRPEDEARLVEGPSVIREVLISPDASNYRKPPAGIKADDENDTGQREMCMTRYVNQSQYYSSFEDELQQGTALPYQVQVKLYENHIRKLGITKSTDWERYGMYDWEGIAILACNAKGTLINEVNQGDAAANYNLSMLLETYTKMFVPDVPLTLIKHAVEVDEDFLKALYADVCLKASTPSGKEVTILSLNNLGRDNRNVNPAHVKGLSAPFINLNEWRQDAGKIAREWRIFVRPFVPVNNVMLRKFENEIRDDRENTMQQQQQQEDDASFTSDVTIRVHEHQLDTIETLRAMPMKDRCDVMLGHAVSPDVTLFSPEELGAMSEMNDEDSAPILRWEKSFENGVQRMGFHMLVYAISPESAAKAMDRWQHDEPEYFVPMGIREAVDPLVPMDEAGDEEEIVENTVQPPPARVAPKPSSTRRGNVSTGARGGRRTATKGRMARQRRK